MTSDTKAKVETKKSSAAAEKLQAIAKPAMEALYTILPVLVKFGKKANELWSKCDDNIIAAIVGFVFCFFGGMFPTLFSAIQAAEQGGRATLVAAVKDLADEASIIIEESKKDDKEDKDKDGVADVNQIESKEYVKRKTLLVMAKCNPNKIDKAISSMYHVWLSVMAVLVIKFAKTIQMANSISDFMVQPVNRFIAPVIKAATPDQYDKWVPVILTWCVRFEVWVY
jgi:hypothetical protein